MGTIHIAVKAGEIKLTATVTPDGTNTKVFAGTVNFNNETNTLELNNIVSMDKVAFTIAVKNDSTVPVKYRTVITGTQDDGLLAGLKLTLNGTEYNGTAVTAWNTLEVGTDVADVNVVVELPRTAGDEYQGKSCVLNYKVEAVQGNVDPAEGLSLTGGNTYLNSDVTSTLDGEEYSAVKASGDETAVTINGGNYVGQGKGNVAVWADNGATVTLNGGTFNGGEGGNNQAVQVRNGATVTIKDGYFTVGGDANGKGNSVIESNGGNIVIEGGFFKTDYAYNEFYYVLNQQNNNPGTITVKGGTFVNYDPSKGDDNLGGNFVADGYHVVKTVDGENTLYTVVSDDEIETVESTGAITGEKVLNDIVKTTAEKSAAVIASGENANVTIKDGYYTTGGKDAFALWAENNAKVTIESGTFNGGAGGNNQAVQVRNGATVTIKDGYFTVGGDANGKGNSVIESNGGNIVIEGGFFKTDYAYNEFYYVLNQQNNNPGTITVKGGTFVNYDPSKGDDNLGGNFVAEGYKVVSKTVGNDTWYTVVKK